jgi:hypothetical protein
MTEQHMTHRRLRWIRRLVLASLCIIPLIALAHGISNADKQRMLDGGYLQYIGLGASHMLTGYDHLLFLFGVVFFLTGFKDIAKFVTAFTLGHCVTLITATFLHITWNYFLVDALIAVSVIYKGFDNKGGFQSTSAFSRPTCSPWCSPSACCTALGCPPGCSSCPSVTTKWACCCASSASTSAWRSVRSPHWR